MLHSTSANGAAPDSSSAGYEGKFAGAIGYGKCATILWTLVVWLALGIIGRYVPYYPRDICRRRDRLSMLSSIDQLTDGKSTMVRSKA